MAYLESSCPSPHTLSLVLSEFVALSFYVPSKTFPSTISTVCGPHQNAKMILPCLRMLVRILLYQSLAVSALPFHRRIGFILTEPYGVEKSQIYENESEMED